MKWWPRRREPTPQQTAIPAAPVPTERRTGEDDHAFLKRLAVAHLGEQTAERWLALVRPAVRLVEAGPGEPVVARLGGSPRLPDDFAWPVWEGHGPLAFVGEIDLAGLATSGLDTGLALPAEGRLLAFYFDGSYDDFQGLVGTWDPASLAGVRLVHVLTSRDDHPPRDAPERVERYVERELTGRAELTYPDWEHPALALAFGRGDLGHVEWMQHPVNADSFQEELYTFRGEAPHHRLGGWADPQQGPVEYEVAEAALNGAVNYGDDAHTAEALRWDLLLQVDSDDDATMMWGDVGMLYWMTRDGRSPAGALATTSFTWQCG
jgi:uncharacterized protein YwqG